MEQARSSGAGSGNSGAYSPDIAESLRFEEEIQSLMLPPAFEPPPVSGSSFTALLGLPPSQAVDLLHHPPSAHAPATAAASFLLRSHRETLLLGCSPTFPSNAALVDRAARFSVYAAAESLDVSNSGEMSPAKLKAEPDDSGDPRTCGGPTENGQQRAAGNKRREAERSKAKSSTKKSKGEEESTGGEKMQYVHVRARRGQATDSHSLAERARREKINARMKLLQEIVPGCSKITGTALVLDEIISHVQSLQRQVEYLSMRLAAVNPMMDFGGLDNTLTGAMGMGESSWDEGMVKQQMWMVEAQQQHQRHPMWERDGTQHGHIFAYDSSNPKSVTVHSQLKTELVSLSLNQLKTEM